MSEHSQTDSIDQVDSAYPQQSQPFAGRAMPNNLDLGSSMNSQASGRTESFETGSQHGADAAKRNSFDYFGAATTSSAPNNQVCFTNASSSHFNANSDLC